MPEYGMLSFMEGTQGPEVPQDQQVESQLPDSASTTSAPEQPRGIRAAILKAARIFGIRPKSEKPLLTPRPIHSAQSEGHYRVNREQVRQTTTQNPQGDPSQ